jgi:uncharacterized protein with PIN domain
MIVRIVIRFYAELNDFLQPRRRGRSFEHSFEGRVSVKDLIESLGVPHTEVELMLANGEPVDFAYLVQDGDRFSVYPVFRMLDISSLLRVRPDPPAPRFVLDAHLGKLATYLRMLGFDTLYRNDYDDEELAEISDAEGRILLTRDLGLLKRSLVTHGYFMRETNPQLQVVEVMHRFRLFEAIEPLQRCMRCNGLLVPTTKEAILERLPPRTGQYYDDFYLCEQCGQVYWRGAHYERILDFIAGIRAQRGPTPQSEQP